MARQYYSKRYYDRLSNGPPDTPEIIAERIRYREICQQVNTETEERYPAATMQTPEDWQQRMDWSLQRIKELVGS